MRRSCGRQTAPLHQKVALGEGQTLAKSCVGALLGAQIIYIYIKMRGDRSTRERGATVMATGPTRARNKN